MPHATLRVRGEQDERCVRIDKPRFHIGRGPDNDLVLVPTQISRHHAVIVVEDGRYILRDHPSRTGTWVNGQRVAERHLEHGDVVHLGPHRGVDLSFEHEPDVADATEPADAATVSVIADVGHVATLLAGLRALGGGRVLDDVLALVLDAALAVSEAERGFIMLAASDGRLEFKLARDARRQTLPDSRFRSRRVPSEVFGSGRAQFFTDFPEEAPDRDVRASAILPLRTVLCLPLVAFDFVDGARTAAIERRIGVLYLDGQKKGRLVSPETRSALEALATNAALAIENARLYREALEKARLEHEMRVAAEIQQLLLPVARHGGPFCEAAGLTLPCRSIGGDFFDYFDVGGPRFAFALGDVSGKGPPAALLSTLVLGVLADQRAALGSPAHTVARINDALAFRPLDGQFATLVCGEMTPDGRLTYCNAGHNAPLVIGPRGVRRLAAGGLPVGIVESARFDEETVQLEPDDRVVVYSDGVSDAFNADGAPFGEARVIEAVSACVGADPAEIARQLTDRVRAFAGDVPASDDITTLVLAYAP